MHSSEMFNDNRLVISDRVASTWFKDESHAIIHREDGPAIIHFSNRLKEWYKDGVRHRLDGPAVESFDGKMQEWWVNGELHREDGPAKIYPNVRKEWYQNGLKHRVDGPARIYSDGDKEWWQNGVLHRLDGPAIEPSLGSWTNEIWAAFGIKSTETGIAHFNEIIKNTINKTDFTAIPFSVLKQTFLTISEMESNK